MRQQPGLLLLLLMLSVCSTVRFSGKEGVLEIYSEVRPFFEDANNRRSQILQQFRIGDCVWSENECPHPNISFWLYTRANRNNPWQLHPNRSYQELLEAPFREGKKWKLLIHGYTGYRDFDPNPQLRPALLDHGDYNVISVDYGPLVREPCYIAAVANVPVVAKCTAQLIDMLNDAGMMKMNELHVLAFSLGGQVAGNLKNYIKAGPIPRISAMDPAMPLFLTAPESKRLDASDAKFVDVIHTNAGLKGMPVSVGHVDFFPNGGYTQYGCHLSSAAGLSGCNHLRAVLYYAESISSKVGFWAVPCNSIVYYLWGWCPRNETNQIRMGFHTPRNSRGNYYLSTNDHSPYARGDVNYIEEK